MSTVVVKANRDLYDEKKTKRGVQEAEGLLLQRNCTERSHYVSFFCLTRRTFLLQVKIFLS